MAALPNELPMIDTHQYVADANVFSATLDQPKPENVDPQAPIVLDPAGGYKYKPADPLKLDGIISYTSGYTQVAGHPSVKLRGFTTLATSVVENLNVLDVITADRVVGQISTTHPALSEGEVPSVSFLGTRFDNLRIGGHKVEVERHLDILGPKPADDLSYFEDRGVYRRLAHQYANIHRALDLPDWASEEFAWNQDQVRSSGKMKCSLVSGISGAPGITFGHVIDLPHFGRIYLGELLVTREKSNGMAVVGDSQAPGPDYGYVFHLHMIRLQLGCIAHGTATIIALDTNGGGKGGPHPGPPPPPPPPTPRH